jgi:Ala-tRNA(Pro) deacylase
MKSVEKFLEKKGIDYVLHEHTAVFTCEEAEKHCSNVPGVPSKNLFLRDDKKRRYFLVILDAKKRADLKKLGEELGVKRLSFANSDELKEKLGLEPGEVSIFGLLNDSEREVELFFEKEFLNAPVVNFHPNRNTASIELTNEMLKIFLKVIERDFEVIDIS